MGETGSRTGYKVSKGQDRIEFIVQRMVPSTNMFLICLLNILRSETRLRLSALRSEGDKQLLRNRRSRLHPYRLGPRFPNVSPSTAPLPYPTWPSLQTRQMTCSYLNSLNLRSTRSRLQCGFGQLKMRSRPAVGPE